KDCPPPALESTCGSRHRRDAGCASQGLPHRICRTVMHPLAISAVLLAALTHATWNLAAKRAARSRHFVWLYSVGSVVLYMPIIVWILLYRRPHFEMIHWAALTMTGFLHIGYSLLLQAGYRASDLSLVYPIARGTGPLLSFIAASVLF